MIKGLEEQTKYSKWYFNIINKRKTIFFKGYGENHHITPRSLGGSDNKENIVRLTAREHFVCHLLLTKMFPNNSIKTEKMIRAWCWMAWSNLGDKRVYRINSRLFEKLKVSFSEFVSVHQTLNNSQAGTRWIYNPDLKKNKKIKKEDTNPSGWFSGRVFNWKKCYERLRKNQLKQQIRFCKQCNKQLKCNCKKFCSRVCCNKHFYNNPLNQLEIKKGQVIKKIKHTDFYAYKACGWKKI